MNRQDAKTAKNLEWEEHKILAVLASWRFVPPKAQLVVPDASLDLSCGRRGVYRASGANVRSMTFIV